MNELQDGPEPVQSEDKVMLILSYLGIFSLIPFFTTQNEYVKWHAKQGLTLVMVYVVSLIAAGILAMILAFLPVVGPILGGLLMGAVSLGTLAVAILAILKALGGFRWPIPYVADLTTKLFK
ncbi:MAG: hypothetical protein FWG75_03135 [Cystobacterineae bacterium]|nr:hypothetical protein [Cystobacterineae bacterium]